MVNINSNYAASFAANAAKQKMSALDSAMERLSTGKRINYARDDAAGQAIATRLTAEIQGLAAASRNAADGQSMVDTADGALQETQTLLLRMRELAVQSSNATNSTADRAALQSEAASIEAEITRISDDTTFAGLNLVNSGLSGGITFQIGADSGQTITHSILNMANTGGLIALSTADTIGTLALANNYISFMDNALSAVATEREQIGAVMNRLDHTIANLDNVATNLALAKGRIEDADFAAETSNLARTQVLQQASMAMLAQANASKQNILSLFQ